jgi:hypothetical protein
MYTFLLFGRVFAILLLTATAASAQNLIQNGAFDASADGWTMSDAVEWSPFGMDYGSIHLASETTNSTATQCVSAEGGEAFVVSAEVTGRCAGARLYAIWSDRDDCSDFRSFPSNFNTSKLSNQWELLTVTVPARDDAYKIFVELLNNGSCSGGYFFDDVTLRFDAIYGDGFEGDFGVGGRPLM